MDWQGAIIGFLGSVAGTLVSIFFNKKNQKDLSKWNLYVKLYEEKINIYKEAIEICNKIPHNKSDDWIEAYEWFSKYNNENDLNPKFQNAFYEIISKPEKKDDKIWYNHRVSILKNELSKLMEGLKK